MKNDSTRKNHRVFFYRRTVDSIESPGSSVLHENPMRPGADSMFKVGPSGELLEDDWTLVTSALCSIERASRPIEIVDGQSTTAQTQYVLRTNWNRRLTTLDTHCIALVVLTDKIYEIIGEPIDNDGLKRELLIYVVDNVTRVIDLDSLPRTF